jgi:hypothetical protein
MVKKRNGLADSRLEQTLSEMLDTAAGKEFGKRFIKSDDPEKLLTPSVRPNGNARADQFYSELFRMVAGLKQKAAAGNSKAISDMIKLILLDAEPRTKSTIDRSENKINVLSTESILQAA